MTNPTSHIADSPARQAWEYHRRLALTISKVGMLGDCSGHCDCGPGHPLPNGQQGVVQNVHEPQQVTTLAGGSQTLVGGPVGSWEPIKLLSGDGGGAFNANSAHPFEDPGPLSNVVEIVMMLLVPVCFIRMFGKMVGSHRQGWALLAVATVPFAGATEATISAQHAHHDVAAVAAGGAVEGTETRFGTAGSAFASLTDNTAFYNTTLAVVMLLGRYLPIIFVLALASGPAAQRRGVTTAGTLPTDGPLFVTLVASAAVLIVGLEYLPVLALGPLAEGVH
jgi:K+-transporting ATPase A subunit